MSGEKFYACSNTPTGPFNTKCTLVNFNNNVLTAYCANDSNDGKMVFSRLDMNECDESNGCSNVRVGNDGRLIC